MQRRIDINGSEAIIARCAFGKGRKKTANHKPKIALKANDRFGLNSLTVRG